MKTNMVCCNLFYLANKAQIKATFPYFLSDPVVIIEGHCILIQIPFHLILPSSPQMKVFYHKKMIILPENKKMK